MLRPSGLLWNRSLNGLVPFTGAPLGNPALPALLHGRCHCGLVTFTPRPPHPAPPLLDCDCSICSMRGYLHLTLPQSLVSLPASSAAHLTTYRFASHVAKQTFCRSCGVQPLYVPRSNPDCFALNACCLALAGLRLPVHTLDGKTFTGSLHIAADDDTQRKAEPGAPKSGPGKFNP